MTQLESNFDRLVYFVTNENSKYMGDVPCNEYTLNWVKTELGKEEHLEKCFAAVVTEQGIIYKARLNADKGWDLI